MENLPLVDEELLRRLPLPLARLYRKFFEPQSAFQRYLKAFQLWEASLRLLASVALAEYGQLPEHDPEVEQRLKKLLRPSLGDWRAAVKLLVPLLAKQGVAGFASLNEFLFDRTHHDLPLAAGLMAALQQAKDGKHHSRATVRLDDLFLKVIESRNDIAHGAAGHEDDEIYERLSGAMLAGIAQILARCDVLAGRRLVAVYEVSRGRDGYWSVGWRELRGQSPVPLDPLSLPPLAGSLAPQPFRIYLAPQGASKETSIKEAAAKEPSAAGTDDPESIARALVPLYPLLVCGDRAGLVLLYNKRLDGPWNGRGKVSRTEQLNYDAGGSPIDSDDPPSQELSWVERLLGYSLEKASPDDRSPEGVSPEDPLATPAVATPTGAERWIGEFRILGRLGQGGMGTVYRAWDPSLNRVVALKVLLKSGNQEHQQRFAREIRALGQVKDPHLAEVFSASADGDQFFYAMELIEGATLDSVCERLQEQGSSAGAVDLGIWRAAVTTSCDRMRQDEMQTKVSGDTAGDNPAARPAERTVELPPGSTYVHCVAELVRQVARAAHKLHLTGAIHRDIKPGNIMVRSSGTHAVLIDLGLAQLADETEGKLTRTRQIMGTLRYASPEQVLNVRKLDGRSDVYSLGATLWELLTLQPMFGATAATPVPDLMQRIQYEESAPVQRFHRRVPRDLEAVVMKCLEKNPDRRYQTADELAADIERFLKGEPVHARHIGPLRRTLRRVARRPRAAAEFSIAALLLAAAIGGGMYWNSHFRVRVEYFRDFIMRHGAPRGYGLLDLNDVSQRAVSWRITRRGPRVEKVEAVNAIGNPTVEHNSSSYLSRDNDTKRECTYHFRYNDQGAVVNEIALDRDGQVVWSFVYTNPPTTGYHADARGFARALGGTGAAYVEFVLDDRGLTNETHYLDKDGNPQPDHDGVYQHRRHWNDEGLCTAWECLDAAGKPMLSKRGYTRSETQFDEQGHKVEWRYLDTTGQLVLYGDGYARSVSRWEGDNEVERYFFDAHGKPATIKQGYHRWVAKYDPHGYIIERAYFDGQGRPAFHQDGDAMIRWKCDENGNSLETTYFDDRGKPVLIQDGYARYTSKYDDHGRAIEYRYFDAAGDPTLIKQGYATVTYRYDGRGNAVENAYFGVDGRPLARNEGYARWTAEYDQYNHRIHEAYFDAQGAPALHKDGMASVAQKFDERGNVVERAYFDRAGAPCKNATGAAKEVAAYNPLGEITGLAYFDEAGNPTFYDNQSASCAIKRDSRGNWVEIAYRDAAGKPVSVKQGFAKKTARYDDRSRRIEETFFGESDQKVLDTSGVTRITRVFDPRGNVIEQSSWGLEGEAVASSDGYATWKATIDAHDRQSDMSYYDTAGKPALGKDGYFRARWRYDERGNMTEASYFDVHDKPTTIRGGYARFTAAYDPRGRRLEEAYFGEDGQPVISKDGAARTTWVKDDRGNALQMTYFGLDDKPLVFAEGFATSKTSYDSRDRRLEQRYFDAAGAPTLHKSGYVCVRFAYDDHGNVTETAYFDAHDHPVIAANGYAKWKAIYDEHGRETEEAYFDAAGKPTLNTTGYARVKRRRDQRGNAIEERYYDQAGKPVSLADGYAGTKMEYDQQGRLVRTTYLGPGGQPTLRKGGYAAAFFKLDERGNMRERIYQGLDGKPIKTSFGFSKRKAVYDARGNLAEEALFDENDRPAWYNDEYHRMTSKYNTWGAAVEQAFYDPQGELIEGAMKFAVVTIDYDQRGRAVKRNYFNRHRKPTPEVNGVTAVKSAYDEQGNETERHYLDEQGQAVKHRDGYSSWLKKYDEHGNVVEYSTFDTAGHLVVTADGYAKFVARFDSKKRLTRVSFLGADGLPIRYGARGYSTFSNTYDDQGRVRQRIDLYEAGPSADGAGRVAYQLDENSNMLEMAYFDAEGKPMTGRNGFTKWTAHYDARGNQLDQAFFDIHDKPALAIAGYAKWTAQYDPKGGLREKSFFDAAGKPVPVTVVVEKVLPGSQALRLELHAGDVIVSYAGIEIEFREQLIAATHAKTSSDAPRKLAVLREGKPLSFDVQPGQLGLLLGEKATSTISLSTPADSKITP